MLVPLTRDLLAEEIRSKAWEVGGFSYGKPHVTDWGEGAVLKIGKYCAFGAGVHVLLGGNHRTDWISTYPFNVIDPEFSWVASGHPTTKGNVEIGNDVWIGQQVLILSGVKIGDGACIGAQAVVAKDVPPYAIVVGNPGSVVRKRFTDTEIESLLRIEWWKWDEARVRKAVPLLASANISKFLELADAGLL